jgi:hypothetical protein
MTDVQLVNTTLQDHRISLSGYRKPIEPRSWRADRSGTNNVAERSGAVGMARDDDAAEAPFSWV